MACPVAYNTPKESYSEKTAFISQSKATPDPWKFSAKFKMIQKSNKEQAIRSLQRLRLQFTGFHNKLPDLPTLGKRFWSFIKWMKKDNVGISSLKR